jgi:hypothetical protein
MWSLKINEEKKLLIFIISDTLTFSELTEILTAIYLGNDGKYASYNRFADSSNLKKIKIDIDIVEKNVKWFRRLNKPDSSVKISLFIPQRYIAGFSYLYKSMLSDDLFSVEISDSLDDSAKYLSVDKKLLEDAIK